MVIEICVMVIISYVHRSGPWMWLSSCASSCTFASDDGRADLESRCGVLVVERGDGCGVGGLRCLVSRMALSTCVLSGALEANYVKLLCKCDIRFGGMCCYFDFVVRR